MARAARRLIAPVCLLLVVAALAGCAKEEETLQYDRPLPPGAHALRKLTDPAMWPDFVEFAPRSDAERTQLLGAIDWSLDYLAHPSSHNYFPVQDITHGRAVASLQRLRGMVEQGLSPQAFALAVPQQFEVYQSIGCDDRGTVLYTGYYTPIFPGSLESSAEYRYPLYKLPPDLVKGPEGRCLGRQLPDGRLVPYPVRGEIEQSNMLKGLELVYLRDKFDAYICHVQGSARIRLPDGRLMEVGYAGKNAGEYRSVGRALVEDGKIPAERMSLQTIRQYFREHPEEIDRYTHLNESFVFFRPESGGPYGSLGAPVTPYRSLATDKSVFPRACPVLVQTVVPRHEGTLLVGRPFNQIMLDQDTGGAIRAPGRADIYLGVGHEAGQIAGWTAAEGKLFYLLVKDWDERAPGASAAR